MPEQQRHLLIYIALIHNRDPQRYGSIRAGLETLCGRLSQRFRTILLEVSSQPRIRPHTTVMTFFRDAVYRGLGRQWRRYRALRVRWLPLDMLNILANSAGKYLFSRAEASDLAGRKRNSFIETVVTDKHIRAWSSFLEADADFLLCFEDDAVFKDDSAQKVEELLESLSETPPDFLVYVDLGGGCEVGALEIDHLESGRNGSYRFYSKPVTNTACAYLMSRALVTRFVEMVIRRPWLRLIGVDWLMNKLFMLAADDGVECACLHASPTIFRHGSVTGEYVAWFPDRQ